MNLLLELYSEEIPARMQKQASEGFRNIFIKKFQELGIEYEEIKVFSGPCRITLIAYKLNEFISLAAIEKKGPQVSAPENVIASFAKSCSVDVKDLVKKEISGNSYYFYAEESKTVKLKEILPNLIENSIGSYVWPKSMYWGNYKISWVRPLKNILCLLDSEILPVNYGHLQANNFSYGHKFMKFEKFSVNNPEEYFTKLGEYLVIADDSKRKEMILQSISKFSLEYNLEANFDEKLIDEVTGLVEYPNTLIANIPDEFMHIPKEILSCAMIQHQKYFPLSDKEGKFAAKFIFVANIISENDKNLIKGNEKVLAARLADAAFFYSEDCKKGIFEMSEGLKKITFHANLGNMSEKISRMVEISRILSNNNPDVIMATKLCKSDLCSGVVSEFPELQGIMGSYYAKSSNLNNEISFAIKNHYKPSGANDEVATASAAFVSIADKIDSLVGLYIAGERATGSKDPYGLRRYALGIIRLILENNLQINLKKLIDQIFVLYKNNITDNNQLVTLKKEIINFIEERYKNYLNKDFDAKLVNCLVDLNFCDDLTIIKDKLLSLTNFLQDNKGKEFIQSYKRVFNIVSSSKIDKYQEINNSSDIYEEDLIHIINKVSKEAEALEYQQLLVKLYEINPYLNNFFDNLLVISDDQLATIRRISILAKYIKLVDNFAKLKGI